MARVSDAPHISDMLLWVTLNILCGNGFFLPFESSNFRFVCSGLRSLPVPWRGDGTVGVLSILDIVLSTCCFFCSGGDILARVRRGVVIMCRFCYSMWS